jgi:hypothetical protein
LRTAPSDRASLLAGSARAPAMPSLAGPRPPLGVHPSGSHGRGPVVQPSGVRSAGSVVRGPTVRPAGVRPPGPLLIGGSPAVAVGIASGAGNLAAGTDRVAGGLRVPSGLVDGPSRPGGAMLWWWWSAGGGAAVADLAGSGSGAGCDRARPLAGGGGQLGVRVAGRCRPLGVAGTLPGHDHAPWWSLWSLMARWTGLEGPTRSTVRMGCGPSAAQPE